MDVFGFTDYKKFVNQTVLAMPNKGYGTYRRMAAHLAINSVMVSQVFKGDRDLTEDQALALSEFLGLSELATEYFILLVQIQRAGTHRYKDRLLEKSQKLREISKDLKSRLPNEKELSLEAKSIFYSRWYYSATRLASSVNDGQTPDQLAQRLGLSISHVNQVVQFLVENGLCVQNSNIISMGARRTHLPADSPLVGKHHLNWRAKAISKMDEIESDELFFTAPMVLSADMILEVRKELVTLVERITKQITDSKSETLACLNIDWFKI